MVGIVTFALTAAIFYFILTARLPEEGDRGESLGQAETALGDRKERLFQMLRDLELDFSTGKVGEADYAALRAHTMTELAAVLKDVTPSDAGR